MSLATSGMGGAGLGGGGMSMGMAAHGGPSAMTTHQHTSGGGAGAGPPPGTTAPPLSNAALASDMLDKNQNLNWKQINKTATMPIVSVDLYGDKGDVSYFPAVSDDDSMESPDDWIKSKHAGSGSCLVLKKDDEASYKALRKLLTKSKGYETVFNQSCCSVDEKKGKDSNTVALPSPQLLLGARQVKQLPQATVGKYTVSQGSKHAIDESPSGGDGITIQNGNLDGSSVEQNNNFDRVVLNLRLHSSKKALTVLPEEAVGILVAKAKHSVHQLVKDDSEDEDDNDYLEYPPAFALPAWACYDNTIDSLMDACQGTNPVLYQRSVAALTGALLPKLVIQGKKQTLKNCALYDQLIELLKTHAKKMQIAEQKGEALPNQSYGPMVVMAGMTDNGLELTAIEIKKPNSTFLQSDCHAAFGEFNVISTVAYHHSNPASLIQKAFCSLTDNVDEVCPDLEDDGGVAAIITYGTIEKQLKLKSEITKTLNGIEDDEVWKSGIRFHSTKEEAPAIGTSVLAAVSHARIERPSITVKNVAPTAVGLAYNFNGGSKESSWTEPKIIFDHDRRVPAGPKVIEFSAAECVALRENPSLLNDMEKLVEEAEKWKKEKFNGLREEAALALRVRVVQKAERDGAWRQVDDVMSPLCKLKDGDDESGDQKYAIETSTLGLSLDSLGCISADYCSDGQSIEQALKSARSSTFWYYLRWILVVGFIGGFLVKSFVEDRIRERDVKRVLAFYKHAAPGTIIDGDKHNAYYLCWKYKNKKDKLWKRLETKYDTPVLSLKEYEELEAEEEAAAAAAAAAAEEAEDEDLDLDAEDSKEEL